MIALYRPMNIEVHDEHEDNCAATLCECELPGYREQVLGFDDYYRRRGPHLLRCVVAAMGVCATVVALWIVKAWG